VRLTEEPMLTVKLNQSVPEYIIPGTVEEYTVTILDGQETYVPGTGKFFYRLDGGAFTEVALTSLGGNLYGASLPMTYPGDTPEFYFEAEGSGGTTIRSPFDAPTGVYSFALGVEMVALRERFTSDPGWSAQGQWAYGIPTGGGGQYGNPDPSSGYTGARVYGYNLAGDYGNNLPEYHLTSTAIDCSDVSGGELSFMRWLNVEQPSYDHAYLRISTNGSTFTDVWENGSTIEDDSWTKVTYDVSSIVDGQSTVYLRWTMGTTDTSWQYSGWNIDDLEMTSFDDSPGLWSEGYDLSVAGSSLDFHLDAGVAQADKLYLMIGTMSGTEPGFTLRNGLHVPLNWDPFCLLTLNKAGTGPFQDFLGILDSSGQTTATLDTQGPLDASLIGIVASFAYVAFPLGDYVSNPIDVTFVP
jgi:hypothetical protein